MNAETYSFRKLEDDLQMSTSQSFPVGSMQFLSSQVRIFFFNR